jgi:CheY-like chemotaxis protein
VIGPNDAGAPPCHKRNAALRLRGVQVPEPHRKISTASDLGVAARALSGLYPPPRVLLADAHDDTRDLYRVWLTQHGFLVKVAASGDDALAQAHSEPPDVIVTEMMLPDGGPAFVQRLRADPATSDAILIVLTTQTTPLIREQALEAGADSYLAKPCGAPRLGEAMASASRARFRGAIPSALHRDAVVRAALRSFAIRERVADGAPPRPAPILD